MTKAPQDGHIAATRERLTHLQGIAARTEETERRILASAEERLAAVEGELPGLKKRALTTGGDEDLYLSRMEEVGRLRNVIATARSHLGMEDAS